MTSSMLNLNQSAGELNDVYSSNYYDYLHSKPFRELFHVEIARLVGDEQMGCMDVACGEGWLADVLPVPYFGFDGSGVAIDRAKQLRPRPGVEFAVGRVEAPPEDRSFGTVVFGGLFSVIINPSSHVEFIEKYRSATRMSRFILYDMTALDTKAVDNCYEKVGEFIGEVDMPGLQDIKRRRKVLLYKC